VAAITDHVVALLYDYLLPLLLLSSERASSSSAVLFSSRGRPLHFRGQGGIRTVPIEKRVLAKTKGRPCKKIKGRPFFRYSIFFSFSKFGITFQQSNVTLAIRLSIGVSGRPIQIAFDSKHLRKRGSWPTLGRGCRFLV